MPKHLTDADIDDILGILDGWRGALSWKSLCAACVPVIGKMPSRQTLHRIARIQDGFRAAKMRLKEVTVPDTSLPTVGVLMQRNARLEAKTQRLERENTHLLEQFVVWQYNAHVHGMTDAELNRALPSIDLGNTE